MYIADLHIHSKYSRATSRDCDTAHLDFWARRKGFSFWVLGTLPIPLGEPNCRKADSCRRRLYRLAGRCTSADSFCQTAAAPRFVLSGEISSIYKKGGRTRKVHNVILLPSLEDAQALAHRLEAIGNIHSDGRPILGWTAGICWKLRWMPALRRYLSPPISGRRISPCSGLFPALTRWKNVLATCPDTSTRWKPAFPPTLL